MGRWGIGFLQDDEVLDFLEELGEMRTLQARHLGLDKALLDYGEFESARVAGTNQIIWSEAEIQDLIRQGAETEESAESLRIPSRDEGEMEAARLLIALRLMLSNIAPIDEQIPAKIREGLLGGYVPKSGHIDRAISALQLLKGNVARWPGELSHLKKEIASIEARLSTVDGGRKVGGGP